MPHIPSCSNSLDGELWSKLDVDLKLSLFTFITQTQAFIEISSRTSPCSMIEAIANLKSRDIHENTFN